MYRDEVERVSGWKTSRMRMDTETKTKGGMGRVVLKQRRKRQKSDKEGKEDVRNNQDLSLVPMLVKSWDYFMVKCLAQNLEL